MGATMPVKLPLNPKFGPDVRVSLQEEAKLILDGDREVDIVIVDVSHNGFRIRSNDTIRTSSAGRDQRADSGPAAYRHRTAATPASTLIALNL